MHVNNNRRILQLQTGGGLTGGIAGYIASLTRSKALSEHDFIVTVGPSEDITLSQNRKYDSAELVVFPHTYGFFSIFRRLQRLRQISRKGEVGLVHSHALRAGFLCALLRLIGGPRFVHTNHGLRFHQKSGGLRQSIWRHLDRFVLIQAEKVICIRNSDADLLRSLMPKLAYKCETIVTRVPAPVQTAAKAKRSLSPKIIGVGSLIDVKRADRFVDWVSSLSQAGVNVRAKWLGDGPLRDQLEWYANDKGVSIEWLGHVDASVVSDELITADILFMTSEFEVLSLAALEAMARGTVIVTTDFFGVKDFVFANETGIILPKNVTATDAAVAIAELLSDPSKLSKMQNSAQEKFRSEFEGTEHMARQYSEVYHDILESQK